MKKLTPLRTAIRVLILLPLFISCGKKDVTPPPPVVVPPDPTAPAAKITNMVLNPTRAWYNDTARLNIQATNFSKLYVGTEEIVGNSYLFQNVTSGGTYSIRASGIGSGGSDTQPFILNPSWSQKTSFLTKNVKLYMIGYVSVGTDTITHQVTTINGVIITDTLFYRPDGTGTRKPQGGSAMGNLQWSFIDNETKFGSSPNDPYFWNIEQLDANTFKIWQVKPDGWAGINIMWRTTLTYRIAPI